MAILEQTVLLNRFIPHEPTTKQAEFLTLECREALYGGSAGGGKSDALLMSGLQYVEEPKYAALILRRTFQDLSLPGALIDRSRDWLHGKAKWNAQEHRWRFPSGAVLQFGYMEHEDDWRRYKSSEFQFIGLDEATEFSELQYRRMFGRLRRLAGSFVPLRFRAASNPGGMGHEFIKRRFITDRMAGRVFVSARLNDNPHLDRETYTASLMELDPLTRAQLLSGNWDAIDEGRFRYAWFAKRYADRSDHWLFPDGRFVLKAEASVIVVLDPATGRKGGDNTAAAAYAVLPETGDLLVLECVAENMPLERIVPTVNRLYRTYGAQYVACESNGFQVTIAKELRQKLKLVVKEVQPHAKSKLARAVPAITLAEQGRVWLPAVGEWVDSYITELCSFRGEPNDVSDRTDTLSYAVGEMDSFTVCHEGPMVLGSPRGGFYWPWR